MAHISEHYDTILFDMDGVITSEENYWNVSGLTVYELLFSNRYYGDEELNAAACQADLAHIRERVFAHDRAIRCVKEYGINSNWDLTYVVAAAALILNEKQDFDRVCGYIRALPSEAFALYERIGKELAAAMGWEPGFAARLGGFWNQCCFCFQEWFLGSKLFEELWQRECVQPGKTGLMLTEEPLVDKQQLISMLSGLHAAGKRLGIGTGRPDVEVFGVLERWGIRRYFATDAIVTYTNVMDAEQQLGLKERGIGLTKPHPYMFLKGVFGSTVSDEHIVNGLYDREACRRTLVVGDAGADLYAAREAGCDFLAVLTGIQGQEARRFFEQEGADYILNSVLELE